MNSNPLDFTGKVALVTGAGAGMGLAAAQAFAEAGAAVLMADAREETVSREAQKLHDAGYKVIGLPRDVSSDAQIEEMVKRTVSEFGRLDAAFNNAGMMARIVPTADSTSEEWDRVININLRGGWSCMKYELKQMERQGSCRRYAMYSRMALLILAATMTGEFATAQISLCDANLNGQLSYQLLVPASEVRSGENAYVTLKETNISNVTVNVWIENTADPGGLVFPIEVRDQSGNLRPEGHFSLAMKGVHDPEYLTQETPLKRSGGCVPLRPGESRIFRMEVGRLYNIKTPGVYSVIVVDHRAGRQGTRRSNSVSLTVTP